MDFYQKLIDIMNKCLNSQIPTLFSLGIILMTHIFKYFPQFESEHINERIECISNFFVEDKCMMGTYPKLINCLTNIISQNDLFTISANFNTNKLHQAAMKDFMEYQRKLKKKIEIRSKIVEIIGPNNYNYCYTNNEFPYKFLKMFPYANQVFIDKKHYSKKKSSTIHLPLINEETKSKNTNLMKLQKYFPFPFGTQTEKVIDFDDQVPIVEDPDVNRTVDVPPETIELLGSIYSEFFLIDFRKDTPESAEMSNQIFEEMFIHFSYAVQFFAKTGFLKENRRKFVNLFKKYYEFGIFTQQTLINYWKFIRVINEFSPIKKTTIFQKPFIVAPLMFLDSVEDIPNDIKFLLESFLREYFS